MPIPVVGGAQMGQPSRTFLCGMCRKKFLARDYHEARKDPADIWVGPYCGTCAKKFGEWRARPVKEIQNPTPRRIP